MLTRKQNKQKTAFALVCQKSGLLSFYILEPQMRRSAKARPRGCAHTMPIFHQMHSYNISSVSNTYMSVFLCPSISLHCSPTDCCLGEVVSALDSSSPIAFIQLHGAHCSRLDWVTGSWSWSFELCQFAALNCRSYQL